MRSVSRKGNGLSSAPTEISVELYDDLQDVIVKVDRGTPVYGTVRERGQDTPVEGALVTLKGDNIVFTCSPSDSAGLFDCGAVPRGSYTAIVSHKEYAGNLLGATVSVGAEQAYLELEVERGYTIAGRVSPATKGIPIRIRMGIESIKIGDMGYSMMNAFRSAQTDAEGKFTIGPLSLGEVTLVAEHLEFGRARPR
ncbi:MAG: carboxypeptidase-like regulatory domain-containing protein [Deltaproteobacteria bacterium]|nr:carboxypeptidase-like regulatory domain-containing protein [Deltaproteobacteria bacterium]